MKGKILIPLVLFILVPLAVKGQGDRKFIRQGNREYKDQKFDESEILYRRALEKDEKSYAGEFNLGDALYKQEKYEDAARNFSKLAENEEDRARLSYLYHNLGNSLLQSNQLEESIEAYKDALRNNPADDETRHNLAFAQRMLQQQQQQQQQQQDQDQDQDQDQQDQQDQDQDQQDQDQQDQQEQNQDQQQQQQQQPQISKEDAERMLQALQQDEQKLQEKLKKEKAKAARVRVLKDW